MKQTLNTFLVNKLFEDFIGDLQEENIISILTALKKKIVELLNENTMDEMKMQKYLKIVAIFEQFFRFLQAKKVELSEIVGLKTLLDKNDMDQTNEENLEKAIEKVISSYSSHSMISFKNIVEHRFKDFMKWIETKDKEDLDLVKKAIEYTTKTIEGYHLSTV